MKKYIIILVSLFLIGVGLLFSDWLTQLKEVSRLTTNLSQVEVKYKTTTGLLASQTVTLQTTRKEFKASSKKSADQLSDYDKKLRIAYNDIKALKLKPAQVITYTQVVTVSKDSGLVSRDSLIKFPLLINRNHYSIELYRVKGTIQHRHSYWNKTNIVLSRERYFKDGTHIKHAKWYFWKSWKHTTTTVCDDSSAVSNISVSVNFD